jgi:hypothetical protein
MPLYMTEGTLQPSVGAVINPQPTLGIANYGWALTFTTKGGGAQARSRIA